MPAKIPADLEDIRDALSFSVPFETDARLIAQLIVRNPALRAEADEWGWSNTEVRGLLLNCLTRELLGRRFPTYGDMPDPADQAAFNAELRRAHDDWLRQAAATRGNP